MAKDDYDVIVYRVLVYYYACLKRKIIFEENTFDATVKKNIESDEYFYDVLRMMQDEGLIEGLVFVGTMGGDIILASSPADARITPQGIRYLTDNEVMKRAGNFLKKSADTISKIAALLSLV